MDVRELPAFLGEQHLAAQDLPAPLQDLVAEALRQSLVAEDCRDRLFQL